MNYLLIYISKYPNIIKKVYIFHEAFISMNYLLIHISKYPNTYLNIQTLCPRGVIVKAMDCGIVVREFVLQSRYYVHFQANTLGKGMNPLILPAMG